MRRNGICSFSVVSSDESLTVVVAGDSELVI